jgi:hypothetical protein
MSALSASSKPMRHVVAGAAACGAVSAAACLAVFAMLSDDQVEGPYDGGDVTIGIFGAPVVAGVAAFVIAVLGRRWFSGPDRLAHTALPVGLWLTALLGIAAAGGERNNEETGVLWAATAFLAHLLVASVAAAGSAGRRALAVLALAAVCGAAGCVTVAAQHRWRTQKFARVGVPPYVPEVPGYRLTSAYAGRSVVSLLLESDPGRGAGPERLGVSISRSAADQIRCRPGSDDRWVTRSEGGQARLSFCLPAGGSLSLGPMSSTVSIEGLLPSVRLRKTDAGELARYPDGGAEREAD